MTESPRPAVPGSPGAASSGSPQGTPGRSSELAAGLRLAVGTLTIVPVGPLPPLTRPMARWAMILAPVAALPLGLGAAVIVAVGQGAHVPPLVTAALVVAALGWGTRAMHWDGLADTADGLAAAWDRDRALAVMRRGDAGPVAMGVLTLTLVLDVGAAASLLGRPYAAVLVGLVVMTARAACAITASDRVPSARAEGLGAVVASSVPVAATLIIWCVVGAGMITGGLAAGVGWPQSLAAVAAAIVGVVVLAAKCTKAIGGVTGDVMGAGIEVAQCLLLVALSAGASSGALP